MNFLTKRQFLGFLVASSATVALAGCNELDSPLGETRAIPEQLAQRADFSLLLEALEAAGLTDTLQGDGPFTLFAPDNAAFAAALSELGVSKEALFGNTPLLTAVLTYHVLASRVFAADIPFGAAITTLQGDIFKVEASGPTLTDGRNRATLITETDWLAHNGVIHVVNKVLLPPDKDIVSTAQSIADFSILVEALEAAGLVSLLQQAGPYTVFAPTNAAFAALLLELGISKEDLLADTPLLTSVLAYHVLTQRVLAAEIPIGSPIPTYLGQTISINADLVILDQSQRNSQIAATDVLTSNGVIHVINTVLRPV